MKVAEAKQAARRWVEGRAKETPGLIAAHLVGGVTSLADEAPFPPYKDVDMHLIYEEGSAALAPTGAFNDNVETEYEGLMLEAGAKPASEYASAEAVLANPEIAHHLTLDTLLYDPEGMLAALQGTVRKDYGRRCWVDARLDFERRGLEQVRQLLPMARAGWGASGEMNFLGYTFTFVGSAIAVAALRAPSTGSRMLIRLREALADYGASGFYDEALQTAGVAGADPDDVAELLRRGAEAFDVATRVKKTPHPFQHKINAHLRRYFVDSCQTLLDEGNAPEALFWLMPFYLSSIDIIRADGPEAEKGRYGDGYAPLFEALGVLDDAAREQKMRRAETLYERCFALADEIIVRNPGVWE